MMPTRMFPLWGSEEISPFLFACSQVGAFLPLELTARISPIYSKVSRHVSGSAIGNGHQFHASALSVNTSSIPIQTILFFNAV